MTIFTLLAFYYDFNNYMQNTRAREGIFCAMRFHALHALHALLGRSR